MAGYTDIDIKDKRLNNFFNLYRRDCLPCHYVCEDASILMADIHMQLKKLQLNLVIFFFKD